MPIFRTWPYGTTRKAVVEEVFANVHVCRDENNEGYVLMGNARDELAVVGDKGILPFTDGGPTGGYWKFKKES